MIAEILIHFAVSVFSVLLDGLDFFSIPTDLISVLGTVCVYGNWIVGADLLLLFAGCVVFWTGAKISWGTLAYIWDKLPLT